MGDAQVCDYNDAKVTVAPRAKSSQGKARSAVMRVRGGIVVSGAIAALVTLSACGGDSDPDESVATDTQPRTLVEPTDSSTTTVPISTTEEPTTTTTTTTIFVRLPEVHVAEDGLDAPGRGTAAEPVRSLQFATDMALPGDEIFVGPGDFDAFVVDGLERLTITADMETTIGGEALDAGAGIVIRNSNNITMRGFEVTGSLWGVQVMASDRVTLLELHVHDIGQEAISVAKNSTNVTIADSVISHTGRREGTVDGVPFSTFGEGIYLGSSGRLDDGTWDLTNSITIRGNEIFNTTGEGIDVKASVFDVSILGNRLHDIEVVTGGAIIVGYGVRVYEADVTIASNLIWNISTSSRYSDGNGIWLSSSGQVINNVIWNTSDRGIFLDDTLQTTELPSSVLANVVLDNRLGGLVIDDSIRESIEVDGNIVDADELPEELLPLGPDNAADVREFAASLG